MKLPKKRYLIPTLGLFVLALLLAATVWILPRIVSWKTVKEGIEASLSTRCGGKVRYSKALLQFRPLPQIRFVSSVIDIPGRLTGTIETLTVHPKLLPLIMGRIEVDRLSMRSPRLRIPLPARAPSAAKGPLSPQPTSHSPIGGLGRRIARMMTGAVSTLPENISIRVRDGTVTLVPDTGKPLNLHIVQGRLVSTPTRITLWLKEGSRENGQGELNLDVDPRTLAGKLEARLARFRAQAWMGILFPASPMRVGKTRLDLNLGLTFQKPDRLSGAIACSVAALPLIRSKTHIVLRNGHLSGTFSLGPKRTELTLSELDIADPAVKVTGHFLSDAGTGTHRWELSARDLDLASTGRLVCFIARGVRPLEKTFRILRAGQVTEIHLSDAAGSIEALKKAKGLKIKGYLQDGTVDIPKPGLLLTHATGWVTVQGRTLTGNDLRAHLGKARGHGAFTMTFEKHAPFLLDTAVTADLSELPSLLGRLVPDALFKKEMASIHGVEGEAQGRLRIDHHTGAALDVKVDVSRMALSGTYARIPYPIRIQQGQFRYDENGIRIDNLKGRIGASDIEDLTADIGLHAPFPLAIEGKASQAASGEILRWLKQYRRIARALGQIRRVSGTVSLSAFSMKGPALFPAHWHVNLAGAVKGLQVVTVALPAPIQFPDGQFKADQDTLRFDGARAQIMDTRLTGRGVVTGLWASDRRIETSVSGSMGPESAAWVQKALGVPDYLSWQSPCALSSLTIGYSMRSGIALSGTLTFPDGPILTGKLEKSPGGLAIQGLEIHDAVSHARLSLLASEDTVDLTFAGQLQGRTVRRILTRAPFLSGRIAGDVRCHLQLSTPLLSTATGDLWVERLDLSKFGIPLVFDEADLSGMGHGLRIRKAALAWRHQRLHLNGRITHLENGIHLDLAASMKKVQWSELKHLFSRQARPPAGSASATNKRTKREIPLYGSLKVHADTFAFPDGMVFHPVAAQLNFHGGKTSISITQAVVCGIDLKGSLSGSPNAFKLAATPSATHQDLAATLTCLCQNKQIITGRFDLKGNLSASGSAGKPLAKALSGWVSLKATGGRILRFGLMAKLFTLLNVAGLFQGELPDLEHQGFPYKTTRVSATFDKGILHITNGEINSNAMRIFFQGKENLTKRTHDLTIVVAPLKTVDLLVSHIPLVRDVLDRGLVIYPITVSGTWAKPDLNLLAPDAVGIQIWGIVMRTLKLPLTILAPLIPDKKKGDHKPREN